MRNIVIAALFLLANAPSAVAATPPANAEYSIDLTGNIEVAPDGSVHAYALDDGLKPVVQKLVSENIKGWKFEPILVDGRRVIARTRLRMTLKAVPAADGYALKIDKVWFGEPTRSSQMQPPRYPTAAARSGVGARVVLVLRIDAMGNVVDAHPEQTSLTTKARGKTADRWRRLFETASLASAREWKFDIPEVIDGEPAESSSIRVPVEFIMGGGPGQWHGVIPGPAVPAPWVDQEQALASAIDALDDGEMQPLDSRFKLRTEVVGMVL